MRTRIADGFPAHGIVGEEFGTSDPDASVRWYLDPIDGTHNFIRGVPLFGTLIGIERDGELQVGVVSAPVLGSRWYARRGRGASAVDRGPSGWSTTRRIAVSKSIRPGHAAALRLRPGCRVEREGAGLRLAHRGRVA